MLLIFVCNVPTVFAALTIEITEGIEDAIPIAIVPFKWMGKGEPPENVSDIVRADLARSGLFEPMSEKDMLNKPFSPRQIRFNNWRMVQIPNLVIGQLRPGKKTGEFIVEFRLYDVYRQKQLTGFRFNAKPNQLRKNAHKISDIIYEELIGIPGAFDTQLIYIKKLPKNSSKPYRLYLSDADGFGEQEVMRHDWPLFSPTWSGDNSKLAFAMSGSRGQGIFIFDVNSGKPPKRITPRKIKASAPAWSPDGKHLAVQRMSRGSSDIYTVNIETGKMQQITRHWSLDTEPSWSPDGKSIVFNSERGGSAQIYQYLFAEKKIRRLTFKGKQNMRPSFSPDGKMITFVHLSDINGYNVAVMDLDTLEMRVVADSKKGQSEHESPSFAPNGSMIIYAANYFKKGGKEKKTGLFTVSIDGHVKRKFAEQGLGEVREPAWSRYLN